MQFNGEQLRVANYFISVHSAVKVNTSQKKNENEDKNQHTHAHNHRQRDEWTEDSNSRRKLNQIIKLNTYELMETRNMEINK